MGKLTRRARKSLPPGQFVLPGGKYPIPDASHARNALSRASQFASPTQRSKIKAAVHVKFPGIGKPKAKKRKKRRSSIPVSASNVPPKIAKTGVGTVIRPRPMTSPGTMKAMSKAFL